VCVFITESVDFSDGNVLLPFPRKLNPRTFFGKSMADRAGAGDAPPIFDGRNVSQANLERIGASYSTDGFVCLRLLSAAKCDEQVSSMTCVCVRSAV